MSDALHASLVAMTATCSRLRSERDQLRDRVRAGDRRRYRNDPDSLHSIGEDRDEELDQARENARRLRVALHDAHCALSTFSQYRVAADAMKAIDDAMQETDQ